MAKYRQVQVSFWQDGFVLTLPPDEKYFYLYLMTNSKTTQCGIYELPLKVVEMETGLSSDQIFDLLHKFVRYRKIKYNEETREIFLLNWLKHNSLKSPKVKSCAVKELQEVKHIPYIQEFYKLCIHYGYSIDRLPIDSGEEKEQEEEEKQEEEQEQEQEEMPDALRGNPHQRKIADNIKKYNLESRGFSDVEKLEAFIGVVDIEVIEYAIKESENKSVAYATSILGRLVKEGKTTKDRIVIFPIRGGQSDAKHGTGHAGRTDAELDAMSF